MRSRVALSSSTDIFQNSKRIFSGTEEPDDAWTYQRKDHLASQETRRRRTTTAASRTPREKRPNPRENRETQALCDRERNRKTSVRNHHHTGRGPSRWDRPNQCESRPGSELQRDWPKQE